MIKNTLKFWSISLILLSSSFVFADSSWTTISSSWSDSSIIDSNSGSNNSWDNYNYPPSPPPYNPSFSWNINYWRPYYKQPYSTGWTTSDNNWNNPYNSPDWSFTSNMSSWNSATLNLKWKIEWNYKTVFSWNPLTLPNWDLVDKYILLLNYNWDPTYPVDETTQSFTIDSNQTTFDNWQAQKWDNYYKLIAISQNNNVVYSNGIKITMDWNWKQIYDINALNDHMRNHPPMQNNSPSWSDNQSLNQNNQPLDNQYMNNPDKLKNTIYSALSSLTQDEKDQFMLLYKDLESNLKSIRDQIASGGNLDDLKTQTDNLKTDTLTKLADISDSEDLKNIINTRFDIFYKNQFTTNDKITQYKIEGSYNILKNQYISKFKKILGNKLDSFSQDQLQLIITKISDKKDQINNSTMNDSQKNKILVQLDAIEDIINEKLNTSVDVNLNDLLK